MSKISVVLPSYNEELMIGTAEKVLSRIFSDLQIDYELLFVDDGSRDRTWEEIQKAGQRNHHVRGIHFSRNFGKESAILAGLSVAEGDAVAVMDCDLQHDPDVLPEMIQKWTEGYEIIEGIKKSRGKEGSLHRLFARIFYGMMSHATGFSMENMSDYKLMDRRVVRAILSLPERNLFFRASSVWVGYRSTSVFFEVKDRTAGTSKWSAWHLMKYALTNITSFTAAPLQWITGAGAVCFLCSLLLILYSLIQYFRGNAVEGYSTTLIVLLLIGSAVMMSLGLIGFYLGKIYEELKARPRYLISEVMKDGVCRKPEEPE